MLEELHKGVVAFMASGLVFGGLLALDHRTDQVAQARAAGGHTGLSAAEHGTKPGVDARHVEAQRSL